MAFLLVLIAGISVKAQSLLVINDPAARPKPSALAASDKRVLERAVIPKVGKILLSDVCDGKYEMANTATGSFTRAGSKQTLVFYQFCQTGNGLGSVGVAVIEGGKIEANYIAEEGGWTVDARRLPDINENGLDEIALYFSGGMHQGEGGTGAEIMEFSPNGFESIGWFQADAFFDDAPAIAYRLSVKKGKTPQFYRQRFVSKSNQNWRPAGKQAPFKLGKPITTFTAVK